MIKKLLISICLVISLSIPGWCATYHLSSTGADAGAGPWLTLTYALTGNRMNQGDTLIVDDAGIWSENHFSVALGAGSGTTTIQAAPGITPSFNINDASYIIFTQKPLKFVGIQFTNTGNLASNWVRSFAAITNEFEDCIFDGAYPTANILGGILTYGNFAQNVTFRRCTIKNCYQFIKPTTGYLGTVGITFESCKGWNNFSIANDYYNSAADNISLQITATNNTFTKPTSAGGKHFSLIAPGLSSIDIQNNILVVGGTGNGSVSIYADPLVGTDWIANPGRCVVKNNIIWNADSPITSTINNALFSCISELLPVDPTNRMINPGFTNYASDDYNLEATSYAAGLGNATHPAEGDFNEAAYGANDVGCFVNPATLARPSLSNVTAFFGDSIMNGSSATAGNECYNKFASLTGLTVTTGVAIGGLDLLGASLFIDNVMISAYPKTVMVAVGVNSMTVGGKKTNQTTSQVATAIIAILQKIADYNAHPVWLGIESLTGNPPDNTDIATVNGLVQAACIANYWSYGDILTTMAENVNWKTDYYADLTTNLHPNNAGHLIIATLAKQIYPWTPPAGNGWGVIF